MGKIFTITNDIRQIASDAIDDLINQLGKPCRLYYPPKIVNCPNCTPDTIGHKSLTIYKSGGPVPFSFGACPICQGSQQQRFDVQTEIVTLLCAISPKDWFIKMPNIRVPDGMMQTKGYLRDAPKIQRCENMVVETQIEGYKRMIWQLQSDIFDVGNIIQGRYFVALWRRSG